MVNTTNWRSCCSSAGLITESVAAVMRVLAMQVRCCGSRSLTFLQPLVGLGWCTTASLSLLGSGDWGSWAGSHGSLRQSTVTICPGPIVDEGFGLRVSRNVIGHCFALGPDACPQGFRRRH